MAELNFDADKTEPLGSFEPLPVGEYKVVITASEDHDTKNGRGKYLQLVYDVIEGEYLGRKLFDRLNIRNENETAQKIAQQSLSAICRATGVMHPRDSSELHDKPFIVKVGIRPAKDQFQASNTIKEYKRLDGMDLKDVTSSSPATNDAPATKSAAKKRPWEK
jgi:hypothetical protein